MITPEKLLEAAKQLEPQLQEWRRTLHRHPEVGFDLPQTKALGQESPDRNGLRPAGLRQVRRACAGGRQKDPAR